AAFSCIQI
ncbi:hypothetical protein EC5905_2504, partial [Escherichia coli 5905]